MKGYVARKGDRWYAVIYEGLDPVTGRERRSWHAAGTERADAEKLAARLASERNGRDDEARSLSLGAYLTTRWLPGKRLVLASSTYDGYRRKVERHILPAIGSVGLRRLRPNHLEALYEAMLHPSDGRAALAPKTVYEVHLVIRGALGDAVRRGLVSRNVPLSPMLPGCGRFRRSNSKRGPPISSGIPAGGHGTQAVSGAVAGGHHGVRRSELLGLKWSDVDLGEATMSVNRGIVAVGYELHESRGKTANARRRIDLDPTTVSILGPWRMWQQAERAAVGLEDHGWVFADSEGKPVHPHALSQAFERIARRAGVPVIRLHDLRHTHGTLLIKAGVPVKVVSERLGHATPAFTIDTYQHVLPGMQADAARVFEQLIAPSAVPGDGSTGSDRLKGRRKTA